MMWLKRQLDIPTIKPLDQDNQKFKDKDALEDLVSLDLVLFQITI